jgi:solute:Na+ symporter, SSS family
LLYLVRWYWWRVNAWCEIVAMISSFAMSVILLALARNGTVISTAAALLSTVAVTTICWLMTAYFGPPTDGDVLKSFYRKVRPVGPGWARVRAEVGLLPADEGSHENIPLALMGWVAGCTAIWSGLFVVGNFLYGRMGYAIALAAIFLVSGSIVIKVMLSLWPVQRPTDVVG